MTDKQLEAKVVKAVDRAMQTYAERWVTAETLAEYVEVLNANWLKRNGSCFNRTRVEWSDEKKRHSTSWMYPLHEIQKMIQDGRIKELQVK